MNLTRTALFLCVSVSATGCADINYMHQNYYGAKPVMHEANGMKWKITDNQEQSRLMITKSAGANIASTIMEGASLGLAGNLHGPHGDYRDAAQSYLDNTGRPCVIQDGDRINDAVREYRYTCNQ